MSDAISDLVQGLARGQQAVMDATVWVEWEDAPGRRVYRLRCARRDCLQDKIAELMRSVDVAFDGVPGEAHFIGPCRRADGQPGYEAGGVVIKYASDAAVTA